jgi:hypothetical protein
MRLVILLFLSALYVSCKPGGKSSLATSDSLVVQFNQPGTDLIDKTVSTTERTAISEVSRFTAGKETSTRSCPLDGNILFYKGGTLIADISFNYSADSCRQFIQINGEKTKSTVLSNKAADFLRSLREGGGSY